MDFAQNAYVYGDYEAVIRTITPLVDPDIQLVGIDAQARAWELLGLAHLFLKHEEQARAAFTRLIKLDPERRLDPLVVPPAAIAFFEGIRASLAEELQREREEFVRRQKEEEERRRLANTVEVQKEIRRNSRLVAAMPFGIGQFQNGDAALGAAFLAGELAAIGLSVGFFLAVEDLRQPSGRIARDDIGRAESLQTAQVVSGGAAVGLMVLGAAQALWSFREETLVRERTIKPGPGPAAAPAGASFSIAW